MILSGRFTRRSARFPFNTMMGMFAIILIQGLFWNTPGFTTMYRCHDLAGTTVLTDNPAQLKNCSRIEASSLPAPSIPSTTPEPIERHQLPPTALPQHFPEHADTALTQEPDHITDSERDIFIPLRKIGGSYVVQAFLNKERTAHLIVDTGASMTVLSTNIALDLGILGTTDNELLTVNTAGGSVQVNMNYLSSLNVGNAHAQNVAVAIHDLPDIPEQIEGLLGMSFLKHFLITLDAEHARLILRPRPSS